MSKKRICALMSSVLVFCMIATLLPRYAITTRAEEKKDALGIVMDAKLDKKKEIENNPYGEGWFPLFEPEELFVAKGHEKNRYWNTYDYNGKGEKEGTFDKALNGPNAGSSEEGNSKGYRMLDTAGVDAKGEGQKRYVAVLGFNKSKNYLQLSIVDKSGNRVSNQINIGREKTLEYLSGAEAFYNTIFVSVAAGDFNGDGKDTVIVYYPSMETDETPRIEEYNINSSTMELSKARNVVDNVFSTLNHTGNYMKNNGVNNKVRKNTPGIQMVAADTDKDNIDELIITSNVNNTSANGVKNRQSHMAIYDYYTGETNNGWEKTHELDTKGYSGGYNGAKRLRWCSSAVGNLVKGGGKTDYPEIVTAGWIDKSDKDSGNITSSIGSYVTTCTKTTKIDGTPVGEYQSSMTNSISSSEFSSGGHYEDDDIQSAVPVAVFSGNGTKESGFALISDTVYSYSGGEWKQQTRDSYFNDDDDGIGGYIISNGLTQDAVAGNFSGNAAGKEQVIFTTCQKQKAINSYWYSVYTYYTDKDGKWHCGKNDRNIYHKDEAYMSLTPFNFDDDSTIVKIDDVSLEYSEPEVLTILEATPYFKEIDGGNVGNSQTAYGKMEGVGSSKSSSDGLSTNIIAGFEWEMDDATLGFSCGAGFEAEVEQTYTWEETESSSTEFELEYANDNGENMVVVYRRPITTYHYTVKNHNGAQMTLSKPGKMATSMITVDQYNALADNYNLEMIEEDELCKAGDPYSYRSSVGNKKHNWESESTANYKGMGTQSQTLTETHESESAYSFENNFKFTAYGMAFGVKVGGGAGYNYGKSESSINTYGISKSGAVSSSEEEGYNFTWKLAHWVIDMNDSEVPVLGYVINNVEAPPSPPQNLGSENISSHEATLTWELGERKCDEYRIYQIFEDGDKAQIGVADGTETSFHLRKLNPNTSYTYAISGYSSGGANKGESVLSEEHTFTTLPEGLTDVTMESPENTGVKIGADAVFQAGINVVSDDYKATNYQWQKREKGQAWENIDKATSSKLTLKEVTEADDQTEYRCVFRVCYTSASSLVNYYSDAATLSVGAVDVNSVLKIEGHDNTGVGTVEKPYKGTCDYQLQTDTKIIEIPTEKNKIVEASERNPELSVMQIKDNDNVSYYGVGTDNDGNTVYYTLKKDGEVYSVGQQITLTEKKHYIDDFDKEITLNSGTLDEMNISKEKSDGTYFLQAVVNGEKQKPLEGVADSVDTRLASVSDITYVWKKGNTYYKYLENGDIGEAITVSNPKDLYDVYQRKDSEVVLGRTETWTNEDTEESTEDNKVYDNLSEYVYDKITITAGEPLVYNLQRFKIVTTEEYSQKDFVPANMEAVTYTGVEEIKQPIFTSKAGNQLTLSTQVKEKVSGAAAVNAEIDFYIRNIENNAVVTLPAIADQNGYASVEWVAPSAGLYQIESSVRKSAGYAAVTSEPQYYQADMTYGRTFTEYQLLLYHGGDRLTGTSVYGQMITTQLQQREVTIDTEGKEQKEAWKNSADDEITYRVGGQTIQNKTYNPNQSGVLFFTANTGTEKAYNVIASATLKVEKCPITLKPILTVSTPTSAEQVEIQSTPDIGDDLSKVIDINCAYFNDLTGNGKFDVTLGYKKDAASEEAVELFTNRYAVKMLSESFVVKQSSAQINFKCDENGKISGKYSDHRYPIESGDSKTTGTLLEFLAVPNNGYAVESWSINGTNYSVNDPFNVEGMKLSSDGKKLTIPSFDAEKQTQKGILNLSVSFKSISNKVAYTVNGNGGTVSAMNEDSLPVNSPAAIVKGSGIILTAVPDQGKVVDHWTVNGKSYLWENTTEVYRENIVELNNIQEDKEVEVYFKDLEQNYKIETSVVNEKEIADSSLAKITAVTAKTKESIDDLSSLQEGSSVTFNAKVTNSSNNMVKEWQISTNGSEFTTVKGSGGRDTFTLYNLSADTKVRAVITIAQSFNVNYEVKLGDTIVTDPKIAQLIAASNGQEVKSDTEVSAYIPLDFEITLGKGFYVKNWNGAVVQEDTQKKNAQIEKVTKNIYVTVTIAEMPVVQIKNAEGGTISVKGTYEGETIDVMNGDHIDLNSTLQITCKPSIGYEVNDSKNEMAYTDENGLSTDDKSYQITDVVSDVEVAPQFVKLAKHKITFKEEINAGDQTNGVISKVYAVRKAMEGYETDVANGDAVYHGSDVTFVTKPENGFRVKAWVVNGTVQKNNGLNIISKELTMKDLSEDMEIIVTFEHIGSEVKAEAGKHGSIIAATAGGVNQLENIKEGFYLRPGSSLKLTAKADNGYEVAAWEVNGEPVMNGENNYCATSYTFTAGEEGALIRVEFQPAKCKVSWSGDNAVVSAEGYKGKQAEVRGDSEMNFTAKVKDTYVVAYWMVDGVKTQETSEHFKWTVPIGMNQNVHTIQLVTKPAPFRVEYSQPDNGKLSASVKNGALVDGDTNVTFTAKSNAGYQVVGWKVNDVIKKSSSNTLKLTITQNTKVETILAKDNYSITAQTSGAGTVNGMKKVVQKVAYGKSITLKAKADQYWDISKWIDEEGQEITKGLNKDKTELTISNVNQDRQVTAIFEEAIRYPVSYRIECDEEEVNDPGTVSAIVKETNTKLLEGKQVNVLGGTNIEFSAAPSENMMVESWSVNGKQINNRSKQFVIKELNKKAEVVVKFTPYTGYVIPKSAKGYIIKDIVRDPDDTEPTEEIRKNGTVTLTVAPDVKNKYQSIKTLLVNGYDCLKKKWQTKKPLGCDDVTVKARKDGSYVITIKNVTDEIQWTAAAHKHKLLKKAAVKPTCTKAGHKDYWVCSECGKVYANQNGTYGTETTVKNMMISKLGHSYGSPKWIWNGLDQATAKFVCKRDSKHIVSVKGTIKASLIQSVGVYTATAKFDGKTYTSSQKVKPSDDKKLLLTTSPRSTSVKLTWNKIADADGYIILGAKCDKTFRILGYKNKEATTSYTIKKLKAGSNHKFIVQAYKLVGKTKKVIAQSNDAHIQLKGGKRTNIKKVMVSQNSIVLLKGKKQKISYTTYKANTSRKLVLHMKKNRFRTSDSSVATVDAKGQIFARGRGVCYVYVCAYSGAYARMTVMVK